MKQYFVTKLVPVQAEPMTKGKAYDAGFLFSIEPVPQDELDIPGYAVDNDGLKLWIPLDAFNEIYQVAETPLDRLVIEEQQLREKSEKLAQFIFNKNDGKDFQDLSVNVRALLLAQHHLMGFYHGLLSMRAVCMREWPSFTPHGLYFEQALPMLREGFAIRRKSWWYSKGKFVVRQVPAHITKDIIPKMQSLPDEAKRLILESSEHIDYTSQCLIIDVATGRADSWQPSIADVFADDWELVTDTKE